MNEQIREIFRKWFNAPEREEMSHNDYGTLAHMALLEPELDIDYYTLWANEWGVSRLDVKTAAFPFWYGWTTNTADEIKMATKRILVLQGKIDEVP